MAENGKLMETKTLIHFWKEMLKDKRLLSITTAVFIEQTIKKLEEQNGR